VDGPTSEGQTASPATAAPEATVDTESPTTGSGGDGTTTDTPPPSFNLRESLERALEARGSERGLQILICFDLASAQEVREFLGDARLKRRVERALSEDQRRLVRGVQARKLADAGDAGAAFGLLRDTSSRRRQQRNLEAFGDQARQRELEAQVIQTSDDIELVRAAFSLYWGVRLDTQSGQLDRDIHGSRETRVRTSWTVDRLRAIHEALRVLPEADVRNGVWRRLTLEAASSGGAMNKRGQFWIGADVAPDAAGNTTLSQDAPRHARELHVTSAAGFRDGITIAILTSAGALQERAAVQTLDEPNKVLHLQNRLRDARPTGSQVIGRTGNEAEFAFRPTGNLSTTTTAEARTGGQEVVLDEVSNAYPNQTLQLDAGQAPDETRNIERKDDATKTVRLREPLQHDHASGAPVQLGAEITRNADWLSAVVRHEIAHSLDTALGTSALRELKETIGGWWEGTDFNAWIAQMGDPWVTTSGAVITTSEKQRIRQRITSVMGGAGGNPLDHGLSATHPIKKYWNEAVPVIEAAKMCVHGQTFWQHPGDIKHYNGHFFAINHYYNHFQFAKSEVHNHRVRDYSDFSAAEFFAELYSVFYEGAGQTPAPDPGGLIPVAAWRDWLRVHIHERGHTPAAATGAGHTTPSIGIHAHNPGRI
jgi:hypothetical protein